VEAVVAEFDCATRPIIDWRSSGRILGCHAVGEQAVDIVQVAALAAFLDERPRRPCAGLLDGGSGCVTPLVQRSPRPLSRAIRFAGPLSNA
jgi:hypothetical protein